MLGRMDVMRQKADNGTGQRRAALPRRRAWLMWVLGFATALLVDGILFDGYSLWFGVPMLAGLGAMASQTMNRPQG